MQSPVVPSISEGKTSSDQGCPEVLPLVSGSRSLVSPSKSLASGGLEEEEPRVI